MTELPEPPYPADTRAKGWRFELDLEQIEASDTWALATPEVRPWLLMLWAKAWGQVPCGSLPADDTLVAARIGMVPKMFAKVRAMLMRGWWLATDGRLYHDVIAGRVRSMLDAKRKDADRKVAYRLRMEAERAAAVAAAAGLPPTEQNVPRDSTGTDADGHVGDPVSDATSTSTSTRRIDKEKSPAEPWLTIGELVADGLTEEVAKSWIAHRRARKARLTALAWKGFKNAVASAGWELEAGVLKAITRNWTAFEADWVAKKEPGGVVQGIFAGAR